MLLSFFAILLYVASTIMSNSVRPQSRRSSRAASVARHVETGGHQAKHICPYCDKIFPGGRSASTHRRQCKERMRQTRDEIVASNEHWPGQARPTFDANVRHNPRESYIPLDNDEAFIAEDNADSVAGYPQDVISPCVQVELPTQLLDSRSTQLCVNVGTRSEKTEESWKSYNSDTSSLPSVQETGLPNTFRHERIDTSSASPFINDEEANFSTGTPVDCGQGPGSDEKAHIGYDRNCEFFAQQPMFDFSNDGARLNTYKSAPRTTLPTILEVVWLNLIELLDDCKCPRYVADKIVDWIAESRLQGFSFDSCSLPKRETFMKHLVGRASRFGVPVVKPESKTVQLIQQFTKHSMAENGRLTAEVKVWDFRSQLSSLMADPLFNDIQNLNVNPKARFSPCPPSMACKVGDLYQRTIKDREITGYDGRFLLMITLAIDKTPTRFNGSMSMEPLLFTTSLIKSDLLYQPRCWRILALIPNLESHSKALRKKMKGTSALASASQANYNECLHAALEQCGLFTKGNQFSSIYAEHPRALESERLSCDGGKPEFFNYDQPKPTDLDFSFVHPVRLGDQERNMKVVVVFSNIISDGLGADQLTMRKQVRTKAGANTGREHLSLLNKFGDSANSCDEEEEGNSDNGSCNQGETVDDGRMHTSTGAVTEGGDTNDHHPHPALSSFSHPLNRISRSCTCPPEKASDVQYKCLPINTEMIKTDFGHVAAVMDKLTNIDALINGPDMTPKRRDIQQKKRKRITSEIAKVRKGFMNKHCLHPVHNACWQIDWGSNTGGVYTAAWVDVMHAGDGGVGPRILETLLGQKDSINLTSRSFIDSIAIKLFQNCPGQSTERDRFPRLSYSKGITSFTLIACHEWVGVVSLIGLLTTMEPSVSFTVLKRGLSFAEDGNTYILKNAPSKRKKGEKTTTPNPQKPKPKKSQNDTNKPKGKSKDTNTKSNAEQAGDPTRPVSPNHDIVIQNRAIFLQIFCCFQAWYRCGPFDGIWIDKPDRAHDQLCYYEKIDQGIKDVCNLMKKILPRNEGTGDDSQKVHDLFFHWLRCKREAGTEVPIDADVTEFLHKYFAKIPASTATKQLHAFDDSVSERLSERQFLVNVRSLFGMENSSKTLKEKIRRQLSNNRKGCSPKLYNTDKGAYKLKSASARLYLSSRDKTWEQRRANPGGPHKEHVFGECRWLGKGGSMIPIHSSVTSYLIEEYQKRDHGKVSDFIIDDGSGSRYIDIFTELKFVDGRRIRSHPDYPQSGPWYDWVMVNWEEESDNRIFADCTIAPEFWDGRSKTKRKFTGVSDEGSDRRSDNGQPNKNIFNELVCSLEKHIPDSMYNGKAIKDYDKGEKLCLYIPAKVVAILRDRHGECHVVTHDCDYYCCSESYLNRTWALKYKRTTQSNEYRPAYWIVSIKSLCCPVYVVEEHPGLSEYEPENRFVYEIFDRKTFWAKTFLYMCNRGVENCLADKTKLPVTKRVQSEDEENVGDFVDLTMNKQKNDRTTKNAGSVRETNKIQQAQLKKRKTTNESGTTAGQPAKKTKRKSDTSSSEKKNKKSHKSQGTDNTKGRAKVNKPSKRK